MNYLPVILSYFAQNQDQMYLPLLEEEQSIIQLGWEEATEQPQNPIRVKYIARGVRLSSQQRIIQDIQQYGKRIVLLQFSGHSGPDSLHLSDGEGSIFGIAGLLQAYATNLKLVVLNGCSTHRQVETLFQKGIRAVVATKCDVKDRHAKEFAVSFHKTLCAGKSIQEAYRDAVLVLRTIRLDRSLPEELKEKAVSRSMLDTSARTGMLWGLFTQDTEENAINDHTWWSISGHSDPVLPPVNVYDADHYQKLKIELNQLNNQYARAKKRQKKYPLDLEFQADLIRIGNQRAGKQNEIDKLTKDILEFASAVRRAIAKRLPDKTTFNQVKKYADAGAYDSVLKILDPEKMKTTLNSLVSEQKELIDQTAENQEKLEEIAVKFALRAQAIAVKLDFPDRFEEVRTAFELSLKADRNHENVFAYGKFLQEEQRYEAAQELYEEVITIRRQLTQTNPTIFLPQLAQVLNNQASLFLFTGMDTAEKALPLFGEAQQIYQDLGQRENTNYLDYVALMLNNLGFFYARQQNFEQAESHYKKALNLYEEDGARDTSRDKARTLKNLADVYNEQDKELDLSLEYYKEALRIRRELAQITPHVHLPAAAQILNNLAELYTKLDKESSEPGKLYEEAVQIYRSMASFRPLVYWPEVALTLNNFADWLCDQKEYKKAETFFVEALNTYQNIPDSNRDRYRHMMGQIAGNLSGFYRHTIQDRTRSLEYAQEVIGYCWPVDPLTTRPPFLEEALLIVEAWGEDKEAFLLRTLDERTRGSSG